MADPAAAEAAAVTAFWQGLGLPGLVDMHTHFMPDNVLAKVWDFFDSGRAAAGQPRPIVYRRPEQERLALLRAFGVRAFSALLYPHTPGMARPRPGLAARGLPRQRHPAARPVTVHGRPVCVRS